MFKSVAKNFSILTAATITEAVITFLYLAFIARQLGPSLFGKYILINIYVHITSVVVYAGIVPIALRELAHNRDNPVSLFNDILSFRLALGLAGYLAMMVIAAWLSDVEYLMLIAVAGFTLITESLIGSYRVYYTAIERLSIPSIYSIAIAAITASAGVMLLTSGYGLFELIVSNTVIAAAICMIWSIHFRAKALRFSFRTHFVTWRRLLLLMLPFAPIHVSSQLNRVLNIFMLGRVNGPLPTEQAVGYYSPANSVSNTIVKLVMGIRRVLIPPLTVRLGKDQSVAREINIALKLIMVVFCLPLILATTYMSPEIISLLFGDQYAPSASVLVILGLATALYIAGFVPESYLFSHPEHKLQDYIAGPVTSVSANAILCILLIPGHGILGAAVAALGARLIYFLFVNYYYIRHNPGQAINFSNFWDVILLSILSLGLWRFIFGRIESPWLAFAVAITATLPLIAVFILSLRTRTST